MALAKLKIQISVHTSHCLVFAESLSLSYGRLTRKLASLYNRNGFNSKGIVIGFYKVILSPKEGHVLNSTKDMVLLIYPPHPQKKGDLHSPI